MPTPLRDQYLKGLQAFGYQPAPSRSARYRLLVNPSSEFAPYAWVGRAGAVRFGIEPYVTYSWSASPHARDVIRRAADGLPVDSLHAERHWP